MQLSFLEEPKRVAGRLKEYVSLASHQNTLQARPDPRHTAGACPSGRLEAWSGWPVTCEWDGATRALCLPAARSRVHTRRFVTRTAGCVNSLLPGSDCWRLLPFGCVVSFSRSSNCLDSLSGMRTDGAEARLVCPDTRPSCRVTPINVSTDRTAGRCTLWQVLGSWAVGIRRGANVYFILNL